MIDNEFVRGKASQRLTATEVMHYEASACRMTTDGVHFRVHGTPKPFRKRMRVVGVRPYAYSTHAVWQRHIAELAAEHAPDELWEGAVGLTLVFFRPKPKSVAKDPARCRNPVSRAKATWPIARPDLTSLARVVEDALTGVVYRDDSQVVQNLLIKRYGPRFVVEVMAYQMEDANAQVPGAGDGAGLAEVTPETLSSVAAGDPGADREV